MALYRLIGGSFQVVDHQPVIQGDTIGQVLDLDPALAEQLIMGGAALLPEEQAAQIFTAEDWKAHDTPVKMLQAAPEFHDKLRAARVAHHELRAKLNAPAPQQPVAPQLIVATVIEQKEA